LRGGARDSRSLPGLAGRDGGKVRVGWVAPATLAAVRSTFDSLETSVAMRIANVARWLNASSRELRNEIYRSDRRYDVVVFVKAMDERCQAEAERIRSAGGRIVFDANVNYYEIWGEYDIPGTRPTPKQRKDAIAMTRGADAVVADSSYLLGIVHRWNERARWIPDNVDPRFFRNARQHDRAKLICLVWSGRAQKAKPLELLLEPLGSLHGFELVVVSDHEPEVLTQLRGVVPCTFVPFSARRHARLLRRCDVIVSPKRLINGYELGHTEWKITLGMAVGLPAVASPQQSYIEAVRYLGGGFIADSPDEWRDALEALRDPLVRADLGEKARRTVLERYATPIVARSYGDLLASLP
jgi:glycosyltransferase involved in cell wall biosynthesis